MAGDGSASTGAGGGATPGGDPAAASARAGGPARPAPADLGGWGRPTPAGEVLAGALDAAAEGIALFGPDDRLVWWNTAFGVLCGGAAASLAAGLPYPDFVRGLVEALPLDAEARRGVLEQRAAAADRGFVHERPGPGEAWLRETETPLPEGGRLVVLVDATEAKRAETRLRIAYERYALAIHSGENGVYDWDVPGNRMSFSPELQLLIGGDEDAGPQAPEAWWRHLHPDDAPDVLAAFRAAVGQGRPRFRAEYRIRAPFGERWVSDRCAIVYGPDGEPTRVVSAVRDITVAKAAEREAKEREIRTLAILEGALDAIVGMDSEGRVIEFNPAAERIFALPRADALGRPFDALIAVERLGISEPGGLALRLVAGDPALIGRRLELPGLRPDGSEFPAELSITAGRFGDTPFFTAFVRDIGDRKRVESQLQFAAWHDRLTGIGNRTRMMEQLARRIPQGAAVLVIDVDRFRILNDDLGHRAGDIVLGEVARRLELAGGPEATAARLGGDEFALIVPPDRAEETAARVREALGRPLAVGGQEIVLKASVGIARADGPRQRPEDVLADAQLAMYRAKRSGKGQEVVFDQAMRATGSGQLALENDLRRAAGRGEIWLAYQPIVHLGDGRLAGFEALCRWTHPERGSVPPATFVPLAEETGLILPLGRHVLDTAARQAAAWRTRDGCAPFSVSVNVSPRQFFGRDVVAEVEEVLAETGIAPEALSIEITEGVLIADADAAVDTLRRLKDLGVKLSIDDFGTGYSSLSYLHRFPFDTLKIDRSFVVGMHASRAGAVIVHRIIDLARGLGMRTVAEGVETRPEAAYLRDIGCTCVQGWVCARPAKAEEAAGWLAPGFRFDPC
jgi:diguanylate cyclase (GGDEF)-like protein/PAS domain S-box-containing protein